MYMDFYSSIDYNSDKTARDRIVQEYETVTH